MKFLKFVLCFALLVQLYSCQRMSANQRPGVYMPRGRDYMDVPVRASYMVAGDDSDGFLEDGIIVKNKGTGYIDKRYRDMYGSGGQVVYGRPSWVQ